MKIRPYTPADFLMISRWWQLASTTGPLETMLPLDSTFIAETADGQPALCTTLYLTNSIQFAMVDNLIANPELTLDTRRKSIAVMQAYLDNFAKQLGIKSLLCFCENQALKQRYVEIGYLPTLHNVTTFIRSI